MVCSCFRGQKDLVDVSAPIEPAVPKPPAASNGPQSNLAQLRHASKQHLTPSASGSKSLHSAVPNNAPTPAGGDLSLEGPAAPPSASPDPGDTQTGVEPPAAARKRPTIIIPGSPSSPPAPPKAGHWNVSPVQQDVQRNQQAEAANVEDIEVDLDEVQELSPIPTSTPTPASANGTPENMFRRGQAYQPSPSNLGPHRSQVQSTSAAITAIKDDADEDEEEPEEEGKHNLASGDSSPPGSPLETIHSQQQQQSPARLQPHGSHSDVDPVSARWQSGTPVKSRAGSALLGSMQEQQQHQQSPAHLQPHQVQQENQQKHQQQEQPEESSDWDDDEGTGRPNGSSRKQEARRSSSWDESSSAVSTPTAQQQQPQQQPQQKQRGSAAKLGGDSQRPEDSSFSEYEPAASPAGVPSPGPPGPVGGQSNTLTKTGTDVASTPVASPQKVSSTRNDTPSRSPHPAGVPRSPSRRTAPGPHAPKRPSPLGGGDTSRRGLARQTSDLSDCSDLSLPGEYERYGGGSSEDEEAADRQYEHALALAGGQVAPGATARTTASNNVTPGPAPGAPSSTTTPRIVGTVSPPAPDSSGVASALGPTARSTGFANPIWGEGEEEDSGLPERNSRPQSARPPPTASRFQQMHLAALQQPTSPQQAASSTGQGVARGAELDFDSDSESDWDSDDGTPVRTAPSSGRRLGMQSFPPDDDAEDGDPQGTPGQAASIKWTGVYIGPAGDSESPSPQPESSLGGAIPMHSLAAAAAAAAATTAAVGAAVTAAASTTTPREGSSGRPYVSTTHDPPTVSAPTTASPPGAPDRAPLGDMKAVVAPAVTSTAAAATTTAPPPKAPVHPTAVSSSSPSKLPPPSARQPPAAANDNGVKSTATTPAKATTAPSSRTSVAKAPIPSRTSLSTPAASAPNQHAAATISPSTSASNNIPHFMMPTQSASAHRRSSEDGNTLHPASGGSSSSNASHTGAPFTIARSSTPSNNTSSARVSTAKLTSPTTSGALSRPPSGQTALTRTPSGRQIAGHTSGTPPAVPKPTAPTTTATSTPSAAAAGRTPSTMGTTTSKSAASGATSATAAAPLTKPSPATTSRTTAAPSAVTKPTTATRAAAPSGKAGAAGTSDGASTASSHPSKPPGGATSAAVRASKPSQATGPVGNGAKRASADGPNGTRTEPPPETASQQEAAPKAAGQEPTAAACGAAPTPAPAPASTPAPSGGSGLPFGEWRVVRLKKEMRCCAADGTVEQETHDGQMEVFQCEETLQPGALTAVISHSILPPGGAAAQPKTWVFCPDPLCMESKPVGSDLPQWPPKIILAGGVKITRAEYDHLKDLGLDVTLPVKAPAAPSAV